jgi:hypothetical protein
MTTATLDGLDLYLLLKGIGMLRYLYRSGCSQQPRLKAKQRLYLLGFDKAEGILHRKGRLQANWVKL